jgi:hypothetical protein
MCTHCTCKAPLTINAIWIHLSVVCTSNIFALSNGLFSTTLCPTLHLIKLVRRNYYYNSFNTKCGGQNSTVSRASDSLPQVHWPVTTCTGSSPLLDRIYCVCKNNWPLFLLTWGTELQVPLKMEKVCLNGEGDYQLVKQTFTQKSVQWH